MDNESLEDRIYTTDGVRDSLETGPQPEINLAGIKQCTQDFFSTLIPTTEKAENYFLYFYAHQIIPRLTSELATHAHTTTPDEREDRQITPELSQASLIFLQELLINLENYCQQAQPEDAEKTKAALHLALFSRSPSLINNLHLEQVFNLSAQLERAPHALDGFGGAVYPELEYELNNYPITRSKELAKKILATPVSEQLNYLGVCYKILRTSVSAGSVNNEHTRQLIGSILSELIAKTTFPLARYTAESLQKMVVQDPETVAGVVDYSRVVRTETIVTKEDLLADPTLLPFSSDQESAEALFLFQKLNQPLLRTFLESKFKITLAEIPLRDQLHFLHYLSEKDDGVADRLAKVLHNKPALDKAIFLKSFFACATDKQNGDTLLTFVESAPEQTVTTILTHYAELVSALDEVKKEVAEFFASRHKTIDARTVAQEIARRSSRTLLENISAKDLEVGELDKKISSIEADIILFASIFKTATKEHDSVSFAEIKGFDIDCLRGTELNDSQKQAMEKIFAQNYAGEPEFITRFHNFLFPQDEAGQELLAKNEFTIITQSLTDKKSVEPKIVAFFRLEERGTDELYFAANNVDPKWQSSGLGRAAIETKIKEAVQSKRITATFPPDTEVGPFYIEQLGFAGTGVKTELGKYPRFTMELTTPTTPSLLRDKSMVELAELVLPAHTNVQEVIAHNIPAVVLQFTLPDQSVQAHLAMDLFTAHGYRQTRYLIADQKKNQRWYGFEKTIPATHST